MDVTVTETAGVEVLSLLQVLMVVLDLQSVVF